MRTIDGRPVQIWPLVVTHCSWCDDYPCVCRPEVVWSKCACGQVIGSNGDDLLSKGEAVVRHYAGSVHQAWRRVHS